MNRTARGKIAQQTLEILEAGHYRNTRGEEITLQPLFQQCLDGTKLYRPEDELKAPRETGVETTFEVTSETTLEAAARMTREEGGEGVCCLNFASAKNPGGGFLGGSQAQEESLARSSGLYKSLLMAPDYYEINRFCRTPLYTDHIIYSPGVPVFRHDNGDLLDTPFHVSMITAPAPNKGAVCKNRPELLEEVPRTLRERLIRVLKITLMNDQYSLVLGAWGCGVFRNDPCEVASIHKELLGKGGEFENRFHRIVFAIYGGNEGGTIKAFRDTFLDYI